MIQGGEDVSSGKDIPEQSPTNGIQQVSSSATEQAPVARSPLSSAHRQRIVVSQTYSSAIAAAAHAITSGEGSSNVATISESSLQRCFLSGIPVGSQLQNVTIPAPVTSTLQEGGTPVAADGSASSPSFSLGSPQNLARILAVANPNCGVRTGGMPSQNMIVGVSAASQSELQLVNSPTMAVNVPNLQLPAVCCAVITLPVTTTTIVQKPVMNGGRQENLSLRLAPPSLTSSAGQQTLILGSPSSGVQPDDVTRVHSYSLASASSSLVPSNNLHLQDISPNRVMMPIIPSQKSISTSNHAMPAGSPLKRAVGEVSSPVTTVNKFGSAVTNMVSPVNNLTPFSTSGYAFVTTSNPQNTIVGPSIPNFSSHRPKRIKLEMIPPPDDGIAAKRRKICDYRLAQLKSNRERYREELIELFFLQSGGNMMDFWVFRKRPVPPLVSFLKANVLDSDDEEEQKLLTETKLPAPSSLPTGSSMSPSSDQGNNSLNSEQLIQLSKSIVSSSSSSQFQSHSSHLPLQGPATTSLPESSVSTSQIPTAVTVGDKSPKQTPSAVTSKMLRQHPISAVYDSSIGSQEEIVERAKQEAYVMQRISELRKEGLWSMKRLPKVQEPPRTKAQWDYLLEEMVWLATDFAQERKWKKAAAKKCGRMVLKFHQEKEMKAEKAEKEEQMKLRKIASQVAKEIKQFWSNIEKLVEYKQNTLLEEKRKKFLDLHLNFIVDQTEKYSSWLAQGMNRSVQESNGTSRASSPSHISPPESPQQSESVLSYDNEFLPENSESDDEETIEKEEENICETEQEEEIKLLQAESEVPLEELLESLPPEIFEKPASLTESETSSEGNANSSYFDTVFTKEDVMMGKVDVLGDSSVEDDEFTISSEEEDDESTIQEQEKRESGVDYNEELRDLQAESELSIEDLYLKYADAYASDFEVPESDDSNFDDKEYIASPAEDKELLGSFVNEDKDVIEDMEVSMDVGESSSNVADDSMQDLISQDTNSFEGDMCEEKNPSKEITDIAATAERFQPKGNTLSTTQVCTKVPFLLKHQLREYQHIGLDWLNAMYDKKLNGILADEMGLGKTIQTISLLAHLACEKGIWGPHLIVVPTSVMLNWEMEFKKWCPGFKILTYYGTPKERKQKRMGWTKPNAFHVCITSYKVVVQDHHSFRRKKWKYFILDEAQNIKNFRSQRWQMLLNFQSSHRLLLTGTPLQNSLVELWSLMHFLMPSIFQSHREFKEWFVNPVSGMIEGNVEYNEGLIKRLHKVLRPFLLRRLKSEVEKQLPKKYEHIIMCRLSKRQRFLYDDFMAQTKTKETLANGNFMSVINVLMQLRKVCNHPNMFEVRPVVSPFMMERICYQTTSLVWSALDYDPFKHVSLWALNLLLADLELCLTAFAAHRIKKFQTPPRLIEEIDSQPDPPPRCPAGKIRLHVQNSQVPSSSAQTVSQSRTPSPASGVRLSSASVVTRLPATPSTLANPQRYVVVPGHHSAPSSRATSPVAAVSGHPIVGQQSSEYTLQLLQQPAGGVPVAQLAPLGNQVVTSTPITVQIQQTVQGGARLSMPLGIGRLVQTSTGQHLLLTPTVSTVSTDTQHIVTPAASTMTFAGVTNSSVHLSPLVTPGHMVGTATVLPQVQKVSTNPQVMPPIVAALSRPQNTSVVTALSQIPSSKPVGRVAPLNINPTPNSSTGNPVHNAVPGLKSPVVHSLAKNLKRESPVEKDKRTSLFFMESLNDKRNATRRESLKVLGLINRQRCAACPIYGHDLIEAVTVTGNMKHYTKSFSWAGRGFVNCLNAPSIANRPRSHWLFTKALCDIIDTPEQCIKRHLNTINRFVFVVPAVTAPCIQMQMPHPPPSKMEADRLWKESLSAELSPKCALLHPVISNVKTQFPDLRLIEYDCGKLQRLSGLLWELKTYHHRVLIFTQMTRMLDILEQFLNYHGHTYLRLDGTTKVEERQALMETFNMDKRYFCFILSTRSGGIGVNLTGADTVIFYDSDWNPTMDAQAQDRCHRIGQTRDVHIYRLISEKTVEENILKKANQKKLLGDLAIEGGNFTTAFFKTNTIHDLFGIEHQDGIFLKIEEPKPIIEEITSSQPEVPEKFSSAQLEQALGMAEEELDLQAAKTAHAEAAAELAEFDESIPLDSDSRDNEEKSPAEEELEKLMDQLTPVEKYALQFLESLQDPVSEEQFELAKEEIEAQKKDWELERLKALKEEEERRSGLLNCDEDPLLSYGRPEAYDQVYVSINGQEEMPIWAPPTPPQDENDLYIDYSFGFCYEHSLMPESQLPPIYVKKEAKRLKVDTVIAAATTRKQKVRKDDSVYVPRSLFDRPTAAVLKMRREAKMQKFKGLVAGSSAVPKPSFLPLRQAPSLPPQQLQSHPITINKPSAESVPDSAEWLVHEDWAILQVIQNLQGLSLNLAVVAPAHVVNWDLVADAASAVSRIYRSNKQCRSRYENVIVPREEGKILYDPNLKKQKKTKGIYKTKSNRPMRTSQLYQQDNNSAFTRLFCTRSTAVADIAKRHSPSMKTFTQSGKNPKHASVLADSGINYDQPLTPMQVAINRAERIAREKQKTAQAAAHAVAEQQQQLAVKMQQQQQHVQQQVGIPVAGTASITTQQAQAVIASLTQGQPLQQTTQLGKTTLPAGTVTTVSLSKPLGGGIMVNAASSPGTFATISKALSGVPTVSVPGVTQNAASVCGLTSGAIRNQRSHVTSSGSTTTMTVQETVSTVASLARGLTTSSGTNGNTSTTPAVVSVAGLTAVQLQAAASQRISASSLAAATSVTSAINPTGAQLATTRNVSPSQLHVLRQTALIRQQRMQEMKQQQLKRLQVASAQQVSQQTASGKVSVSSNSPLTASVAAAAVAAANQQRVVHQQAAVKQAIGRTVTEAEVAQLIKRHQISQQKQAVAAAQLQTAQILAQAQLQQVQHQQQVQASIAGAVQTPVATLVKTVSAPTSLGASPSVAIPVSAVTMAGVNINVSLPQGKTGSAPSKAATSAAAAAAATVTQQQLRQLQIQQQLLQQRKIHKVTSVAQLAKVAGKNTGSTGTLPSTTVQILQHSAQAAGNQQGKSIQATSGGMTVQQLQQVIKQVLPPHIPVQVSNAQVTSGSSVTTTLSQNQLLSHHAVLQAAGAPVAGLKTTIATGHSVSSVVTPSSSSIQSLTSGTPSTGSTASVQTRIIPVCQAAPASTLPSQPNIKQQTIQVVTASPNVTASLQGQASLRGEPSVMAGGVKAQTTTLPSTTLTSAVLKGSPTVVVSGQQTTAAIIQQVTSSNASLLPSQAVTLAVRAAASQAPGQVQIQVQQTPTSLMAPQSQIQQLSQNSATINLAQSIPMQASTQVTSVLTPVSGINALPSSMTLDSTMTSPTHVVMSSSQAGSSIVMPPGLTSSTTSTAQVVQAALQAAKQQQQAAQQQQQQQRASPYTMRLRNPPKQ